MNPPASSAATQKSFDFDKVRFFRTYFLIVFPSLKVPAAASPVTPAEAQKSVNKRSSCKVNSSDKNS